MTIKYIVKSNNYQINKVTSNNDLNRECNISEIITMNCYIFMTMAV